MLRVVGLETLDFKYNLIRIGRYSKVNLSNMNYLLEVIFLDGNTSPTGRTYLLRYKAGQSTKISFPKTYTQE